MVNHRLPSHGTPQGGEPRGEQRPDGAEGAGRAKRAARNGTGSSTRTCAGCALACICTMLNDKKNPTARDELEPSAIVQYLRTKELKAAGGPCLVQLPGCQNGAHALGPRPMRSPCRVPHQQPSAAREVLEFSGQPPNELTTHLPASGAQNNGRNRPMTPAAWGDCASLRSAEQTRCVVN